MIWVLGILPGIQFPSVLLQLPVVPLRGQSIISNTMPFLGNALLYDLLSPTKSMNKMWITLRSIHLPYSSICRTWCKQPLFIFMELITVAKRDFDFWFPDFNKIRNRKIVKICAAMSIFRLVITGILVSASYFACRECSAKYWHHWKRDVAFGRRW